MSNLKRTWDLIRSATNSSSKKCKENLSQLFVDGMLYSDPFQIVCKLNEYFTTMPSKIPPRVNDVLQPLDENNNIPLLKVPKREIFDRSDFPDFYTIKSLRVGDFGVKIKKILTNI